MPPSSAAFAISLPVDRRHRRCLRWYVAAVSLLSGLALAAVSAGAGRMVALVPLVAGLLADRRLCAFALLPDSVDYDPVAGWSLVSQEERLPVRLVPGSWFGRSVALAVFRDAERCWLVPLIRPRTGAANDWRRLRVMWRTRRSTLVANTPNC